MNTTRQRPRNIEPTKPFLIMDTLEQFNHAEGADMDIISGAKIITPDLLSGAKAPVKQQINIMDENASSDRQDLKSIPPTNHREDYIKYKVPVHPDGTTYEMTEQDIRFLKTFNEKSQIQLTSEEMEKFLALIDTKSGKDVVLDFGTFQGNVPKTLLPKSIQQLPQDQLHKLYLYWRSLRDQYMRPLLRTLMYPYLEDTDAKKAFRPRVAPQERNMKLRRGNAMQSRGLQEMEAIGQKLLQLKRDFHMATQLIDQTLQREKGFEIERRMKFSKFIKELADKSTKESDTSDIKMWPNECFYRDVPEKQDLPIGLKAEEIYDHISKDFISWREDNERIRKEGQKMEQSIKSKESLKEDIINEKTKYPIVYETEPTPKPTRPMIQPPSPPIITPIIDEKADSIGRFIASLYCDASKYKLTLDLVMNQSSQLRDIQALIKNKQAVSENPIEQESLLSFDLLYREGSDLLYRVQKEQTENAKYYWGSFQDSQNVAPLYKQYRYFEERVDDIMEMADTDQMLYCSQFDDEKHEEEDLKQIRKKIKLNNNHKAMPIMNGNGSRF